MKKVKSLLFTVVLCGGVLGGLYLIPVEITNKDKKEAKFPIVSEEEQLLGESEDLLQEDKVEIVPPILVPEEEIKPQEEEVKTSAQPTEQNKEEKKEEKVVVVKEEPKKDKKETDKNKTPVENKKEDKKKLADKEEKKQTQPKESKIGVDRKLVAGVPGTLSYKGKLPTHNVKEKGSITISYTVDANGNVVSAYRVDGLRDRNTINNAISMVKKYVKAEKSKTNSTGTYTINFK